jgi:hypothetical protein
MTLAGVESLHQNKAVETPEMDVAYQVPEKSLYWRD